MGMKITDLKVNEVIHCKTKEEAVRICGMMHDAGLSWCNGVSYADEANWSLYTCETCYHPYEKAYGNVEFYQEMRASIYPSELFQSESTQSDEITEAGLLERGFKVSDLGGHYIDGGEWAIHVTECVELGIDNNWVSTNCKTLSDIDHLIRLLGV